MGGGAMGGDGANTEKEPVEFSKTPFVEVTAPRKIRSIRFSLMSPQEIGKAGVFHVFERNLYQMPQRIPLANGILDTRMVRCAPLASSECSYSGVSQRTNPTNPKLDPA